MIIVYTPAGGAPEDYDAKSLLVSEVSIVSRTIDMKWPAIKEGLAEGDLDAMRGVIWVLKKRRQPTLRFGDFDPGVDDMVTRLDKTEVEKWVAEAVRIAEQDPEVTREQIATAMKDLPSMAHDPAHAEAVIKEMTEGPKDDVAQGAAVLQSDDGSSPSPESTSSEPSTSASSPTSSTSLLQPSTP